MTKKQKQEENKKQRVLVPFNTGTRTHKSKRDYKRKKNWKEGEELDFFYQITD